MQFKYCLFSLQNSPAGDTKSIDPNLQVTIPPAHDSRHFHNRVTLAPESLHDTIELTWDVRITPWYKTGVGPLRTACLNLHYAGITMVMQNNC